MSSKALEDLMESTRKMMESGEAILADPSCSDAIKTKILAEMELHKHCMEIVSDVINDA